MKTIRVFIASSKELTPEREKFDTLFNHLNTIFEARGISLKPVKWEFENSWGAASGHNGYLTFTDKWFDEYMFRIVINKKYLNEKALEAAKQTPILLPAWDYMW